MVQLDPTCTAPPWPWYEPGGDMCCCGCGCCCGDRGGVPPEASPASAPLAAAHDCSACRYSTLYAIAA
jgi:hypothetical protein